MSRDSEAVINFGLGFSALRETMNLSKYIAKHFTKDFHRAEENPAADVLVHVLAMTYDECEARGLGASMNSPQTVIRAGRGTLSSYLKSKLEAVDLFSKVVEKELAIDEKIDSGFRKGQPPAEDSFVDKKTSALEVYHLQTAPRLNRIHWADQADRVATLRRLYDFGEAAAAAVGYIKPFVGEFRDARQMILRCAIVIDNQLGR